MAISDVQAGRIGEFLLAVFAMLTSDGQLVPFQVDADDDHRDLVVAVKGKSAFASLQAKACFQLGASGFVQSHATYFKDSMPRDPSFIYVVVLVLDTPPRAGAARWRCASAPTPIASMRSPHSASRPKTSGRDFSRSSRTYRRRPSRSPVHAW